MIQIIMIIITAAINFFAWKLITPYYSRGMYWAYHNLSGARKWFLGWGILLTYGLMVIITWWCSFMGAGLFYQFLQLDPQFFLLTIFFAMGVSGAPLIFVLFKGFFEFRALGFFF